MAQFTSTKNGGIIKWGTEDWLAGLMPNFHSLKSDNATHLGTKGLAYACSADPYRKFGGISAGINSITMTSAGNDITSSLQAACSTTLNTYLFIAGRTIHKINTLTGVASQDSPFPQTFAYETPTYVGDFTDAVFFAGKIFFKYVAKQGTKTNVGTITPGTPDVIDLTFMSDTVAGGAYGNTTSPGMVVGADNCLYLIDGNAVHQYDPSVGANGTLYQNVYEVGTGQTITGYSKIPNFLVFYVTQGSNDANSGESFAEWWDYANPNPIYVYTIPAYSIIAGFDNFQGTHGCVVQGIPSLIQPYISTKVMVFNGGQYGYKEVFSLPYPPDRTGVKCTGNNLFINVLGQIFQYGSYSSGMSNSVQVPAGRYFPVNMAGDFLHLTPLSYLIAETDNGTGVSNRLFQVGYNSKSTFTTPQYTPPAPFDYRAKLQAVYINWFEPTTGGHGINISLLTNKANSTIPIISNQTVVTEDGLWQKVLRDTSSVALGKNKFDSIGLDVTFTEGASTTSAPPTIQSLEVHFTYEKI